MYVDFADETVDGLSFIASARDARRGSAVDLVSFREKLEERTRQGWIILNRTDDFSPLKKPREWSSWLAQSFLLRYLVLLE